LLARRFVWRVGNSICFSLRFPIFSIERNHNIFLHLRSKIHAKDGRLVITSEWFSHSSRRLSLSSLPDAALQVAQSNIIFAVLPYHYVFYALTPQHFATKRGYFCQKTPVFATKFFRNFLFLKYLRRYSQGGVPCPLARRFLWRVFPSVANRGQHLKSE
jgi:hypothetical protein